MTQLRSNPSTHPQPWAVWPTLGISAIILAWFVLSGIIVSGLYLSWKFSQNPTLREYPEQFISTLGTNGEALTWVTLTANSMGIGLIGLAIKLKSGWRYRDYLNVYWPKWNTFFIWNGLLVVFFMIAVQLAALFSQQSEFVKELLRSEYTNFWGLSIATVIMAPLFEEAFFRGFMFKGLEHSWLGSVWTIILTTFIWAVIHTQYNLFFMGILFALGLLLGYARHVTKSLWIPISMHALHNGLTLMGGWTGLFVLFPR